MDQKLKLIRESDPKKDGLDFSKVAGMQSVKDILRFSIIEPLKNPSLFKSLGLNSGGKFILFGPPGCGKSFIARAIAGEAMASCFELFPSGTVGDDNPVKKLQITFQNARLRRPSVIIIDEVESLTENRDSYSRSPWMRMFLNEMLSQLDSTVYKDTGLLILGSTNSPWYVDPAFIRPGRFEQVIFVPPPDIIARQEFFVMELKPFGISTESCAELAKSTEGYSCAELGGAIKRSKVKALQDMIKAGKTPEKSEDLIISLDVLKSELQQQVTSIEAWFTSFISHVRDLPKPMVKAVDDYRKQIHENKLK